MDRSVPRLPTTTARVSITVRWLSVTWPSPDLAVEGQGPLQLPAAGHPQTGGRRPAPPSTTKASPVVTPTRTCSPGDGSVWLSSAIESRAARGRPHRPLPVVLMGHRGPEAVAAAASGAAQARQTWPAPGCPHHHDRTPA